MADSPRPASKLTNAQHVTICTLKALEPAIEGPFELYPGSEHYEVVTMVLHVGARRRREFMVAPGGCASEMLAR